ncbi:hypothetical protein ROJ8625_01031 [Roseivivax jejudonensis]|uniref:Uncharacterized protein n=1 Tax=Roseivivax jejudonensis TaxID=1529041 RepID=A0A1X6YLH0_9RHOB|nr:hypothetical protein [Roseivivax jejudonensis]SLN24787.1 hypothetical protein ROJ8625_01031 [Roseivivax jejudonensis]
MSGSIDRLENALMIMAHLVAERPDGAKFIPICKHLEAEIAKLRTTESYIDRMRRLAENGSGLAA